MIRQQPDEFLLINGAKSKPVYTGSMILIISSLFSREFFLLNFFKNV